MHYLGKSVCILVGSHNIVQRAAECDNSLKTVFFSFFRKSKLEDNLEHIFKWATHAFFGLWHEGSPLAKAKVTVRYSNAFKCWNGMLYDILMFTK